MYYLEDICILCLKNNVELHSVFVQDIDEIDFNEKLRCCFPEIYDSTPDVHKLACLECFAKLRFLYESKQSVICSSSVMRNYLDKLQCDNKTFQQPSVALSARKRRRKDSNTRNLPEVKVDNVGNSFKLKIKNLNLNSTNDEQLNKIDEFCQPIANENVALLTKYDSLTDEKDLETKNVEKVVSVTETRPICAKQELQLANLNLNSTNEQLNTVGHSCQPTTNENVAFLTKYNCLTDEKDLEFKNVQKVVPLTETGTICVKQEPQFSNYNINSTNEEQLSTIDHSSQPTANKNVAPSLLYNYLTVERNLETKNVEQVVPVTETKTICAIQEPQFSNINLNLINKQLNSVGLSCQLTANENVAFLTEYDCLNENRNLETTNVENVPFKETGMICVKQEPQFSNLNFNSTNEQLDTVGHSYQPAANENDAFLTDYNFLIGERNSENKNLEKNVPFTETENSYIKQEPQFFEDDSTTGYSEGSSYRNEDYPNFEMSEEGTSRSNDYNNQNINAILNTLKPLYMSNNSIKFCNTCQELLFKYLININLHLYNHILLSNCSRCEDSLEAINKFQRHIFNHCETVFEILDKGDHSEKFSCAFCHQQFNEFSNLQKHISDEHIRSLICMVCSRAFTHKFDLLRHILVTHCHVKLYKCKICPTRFICTESVKDHVFYEHYNGKVCVCIYCYKTFRTPNTLREHFSKHHGGIRLDRNKLLAYVNSKKISDAVEILSCSICHQKFNDVNILQSHMYYNHNNSKDCPIAQLNNWAEKFLTHNISKNSEGIKKDMIFNRFNARGYVCKCCYQMFRTPETLQEHISEFHRDDLRLQDDKLPTHSRSKIYKNFIPKGYVCKYCYETFKTPEILQEHISEFHRDDLRDTIERVTCAICQQQFNIGDDLRTHLYEMHVNSLECEICSKTFTRNFGKVKHILLKHSNVKLYNCKTCFKKFIIKKFYDDHMLTIHNNGNAAAGTEQINYNNQIIQMHNNGNVAIGTEHVNYDNNIIQIHNNDNIDALTEQVIKAIVTENREDFFCKICVKQFTCKKNYDDHINQMHNNGNAGVVIEQANNDNQIIQTHNNVNSDAVTEQANYDSQIIQMENIGNTGADTEHVNKVIVTENREDFFCKICAKQFTGKKNYEDHVIQMHNNGNTAADREQINYDSEIIPMHNNGNAGSVIEQVNYNNQIIQTHNNVNSDAVTEQANYDSQIIQMENIGNTGAVTEHVNKVIVTENSEDFFCKICVKQFTCKKNYDDHRIQMHNNGNTAADRYQVNYDNQLIEMQNNRNTTEVTEPVNKVTITENPEEFSCKMCVKQFTCKQNYNDHIIQMHNNGNSGTVTEQANCDNQIIQKHNNGNPGAVIPQLNKIIVTGNHGNFSCEICNIDLDDFKSSKKHIYDYHMPNLVCVICYTSYFSKEKLHRHILLLHCDVNLLECRFCFKQFVSNKSYRIHMNHEHNVTVTLASYHGHVNQMHNNGNTAEVTEQGNKDVVTENREDFSCGICAEQFTCKKNYDEHIIQTHNIGNTGADTEQVNYNNQKIQIHNIGNTGPVTEQINNDNQKIQIHDSSNTMSVTDQANKAVVSENHEDFSCGICGIHFDDFEIFKKHIYDSHMPGYNCVLCPGYYSRRLTLHNHILEKHCDVKFTKCPMCSTQFKTKKSYKNHMIEKHNVPCENFTCGICSTQFEDFELFKKHVYDNHMPDLKCVICSVSYAQRLTLHRHILEKHFDMKFSRCIICSVQFRSNINLKHHLVHQHNGGKPLIESDSKRTLLVHLNGEKVKCTICQQQFDVLENLRRHILDEHITDEKCVICSSTFCTKLDVSLHIVRVHCNLKFFKCVICSVQFISLESLKNHLINQHNDGKPLKGPCHKSKLNNEVNPVLNEDKFTCLICNEQFEVLERLKRHIYDKHITDEKCVVCCKTYSNKRILNRHILGLHCGIKLFKCKICSERFVHGDNLKNHMSQQHSSDGELDNNKVDEVKEVDNDVDPVIKPEEIFIKEDEYYSGEYYLDEEYEADNYETGQDFSNFAMAEESNSRTSNSYDLEESVGSSVIPNTTATTNASYCEPGAPVDQSNVCDICHKMFLFLSNLSEHLNDHMQESSCSMCKDSAENISRLQRHMLTPCGHTNTPLDSANTANT